MVLHTATLSQSDLDYLAASVGAKLENVRQQGRDRQRREKIAFVLRPVTEDARAISYEGRRLYACNWETHRDFMRELFDREPTARLKTAKADYDGADSFELLHRSTYYGDNTLS